MPSARSRIPASVAARERVRRAPDESGPAARAAESALPPMNLVGYGLDRTREGAQPHGAEPARAEAVRLLQQAAGNQAVQELVSAMPEAPRLPLPRPE